MDVEEIKKRLNIVELVQGYLPLKKAGRNFKANCPFHQEKTASFIVSPDKQIFHCFGCNEGGDAITFFMKIEGLEFKEAAAELGRRVGVEVAFQARQSDEKKRLIDANEAAAELYHRVLKSALGKKALEYLLKERKLTKKTILDFKIGYAPGSRVVSELLKRRIPARDLIDAGIAVQKGGTLHDRFHDRIIFPISDERGRLVGFTARALGESVPKYLNSPETKLYTKSRVLFGLDKAKEAVRKQNEVILVEGNMDVIAAHQAGIANVVASSGTALTSDQLDLLKRYAENIKLAFDVDAAGRNATLRGIELAWERGLNVFVVEMPSGKDPAEALEDSPEVFKKSVKSARHFMDFALSAAAARIDTKAPQGKKQLALEMVSLLTKVNVVERGHYIKKISELLDVAESYFVQLLNQAKPPPSSGLNPRGKHVEWEQSQQNLEELQTEYLAMLALVSAEAASYLRRSLSMEFVPPTARATFLACLERREPSEREVAQKVGVLKVRAELLIDPGSDLLSEAIAGTKRLKKEVIERRKHAVSQALKEAERRAEQEEVRRLMKEFNELVHEERHL